MSRKQPNPLTKAQLAEYRRRLLELRQADICILERAVRFMELEADIPFLRSGRDRRT